MMTTDIIRANPKVLEALAVSYDMEFGGPTEYDQWFRLESGSPFTILAHDASGGVFAECGMSDPKPILHVTSEGQAGIIGHHLQEAIQIIAKLPCWRDHLKFSGGGQLDEMRRASPLLEQEIHEDEPEIDSIRDMLFASLNIDRLPDSVATLHQAVSTLSEQYMVIDQEGNRLAPLFNTFVVTDNPMWKGK
jgi:hypothetical protein